jgi:hypothetical protein
VFFFSLFPFATQCLKAGTLLLTPLMFGPLVLCNETVMMLSWIMNTFLAQSAVSQKNLNLLTSRKPSNNREVFKYLDQAGQ